jgi:hypothetical protein
MNEERRNELLKDALDALEGDRSAHYKVGFVTVAIRQALELPLVKDDDGAPYCSAGHRTKASCDCGPIASNE